MRTRAQKVTKHWLGATIVVAFLLSVGTLGALAAVDSPKIVSDVAAKVSPKTLSAVAPKRKLVPQAVALAPARVEAGGVTARVRAAYDNAVARADAAHKNCGVRFAILAAVGQAESGNGYHVAGASIRAADGVVSPPVYGPLLDGTHGRGLVVDTDGGALDGDTSFDRAVGPMQFMPSTWLLVGADANGDGVADPQSIDDAALAALRYLCRSAPGSLTDRANLTAALYAYNHSESYVQKLLASVDAYDAH